MTLILRMTSQDQIAVNDGYFRDVILSANDPDLKDDIP